MLMPVRAVQSEKQPAYILVMLSGSFTVFRLVHPEKAFTPIAKMPEGKEIAVRLLQPANAFWEMLLTVLGMLMLFKAVQP